MTFPPAAFARELTLLPLRLYKLVLSPLLPMACRFAPSCADYAMEAVHRHGSASGLKLAAKRLLRCHPWGGSGFDPVPGSCDEPKP